jgi:FkbM family methyltransferase
MAESLKKVLRTLQVYFPALVDTKFAVMRVARSALSKPFERDFHALELFPEEPGALYLDVGANRGQSTDAILMKRPNARVCLFEPNPRMFRKLQTMFGRDSRVTLYDFGLADRSEEALLVVPYYRRWMFDGLASFDRVAAERWLEDRIFFYRTDFLTIEEIRCPLKRLDELELAPFFIKLDVQGYEYKALQGAESTIRRHEPVLLIESPGEETVNYLMRFGYEPYAFSGKALLRGSTGPLNTFFLTPRKARTVAPHVRTA